jgi:Mg-chelatase subunit ChlD
MVAIRVGAIGTAAIAVTSALILATPDARAADPPPYDEPCAPVEAIWARGSGQSLEEKEYEQFVDQLRSRLNEQWVHFYQLGTERVDGFQYPAIPVGSTDWERISNSLGAFFSSGLANDYGRGVNQGVQELTAYVRLRRVECPDALFVLGGYSQGAQVVGQAYYEEFSFLDRASVVFTMLFGDPKLYLPEGEPRSSGRVHRARPPSACSGGSLSEWRRLVPNCHTHAGSLRARTPYLPGPWTDTTGLWCNDGDYVCGAATAPWSFASHLTYAQPGGPIDEAVLEAVQRLNKRLPMASFDTRRWFLKGGSNSMDVVFLIDSTGSMTNSIGAAKAEARGLADQILDNGGRIALAEYRDAEDVFAARVLAPLASDATDFQLALSGITAEDRGDTPEAVLHALKTVMNGVDWTSGATKAVVLLTDAGYHDPDLVDGTTWSDIRALSLAIDPVNVYPVVSPYIAESYAALAEATSGQVVADTGDTAAALLDALARVVDRPVAQLPLNGYFAESGQAVSFDGSSSVLTAWLVGVLLGLTLVRPRRRGASR